MQHINRYNFLFFKNIKCLHKDIVILKEMYFIAFIILFILLLVSKIKFINSFLIFLSQNKFPICKIMNDF